MEKILQPKLRFPEFKNYWKDKKIKDIFTRVSNPVNIEEEISYNEIGIRSHGKGIFYKEPITGRKLSNKKVFWIEPNSFVVNIVFAWERAIAKTTDKEIGMIASHRFPMYKPVKEVLDLDFITEFFKTYKGKNKLELASPGGAGRNKTLGQKEFAELKVFIPTSIEEQEKIAGFLSSINENIESLEKKLKLMEMYRKGVMQKIFSQEIRFKDDEERDYPQWKKVKIKDILVESRVKGDKGDKAKKLTVKLWNRGVFEKNEKNKGSENTQYYIRSSGQLIYSKLDFLNCAFGIIPDHLNNYQSTVDLPCFDFKIEVNKAFILKRITQKNFYKKYGDQADGSRNAKRINPNTFYDMPILLPCIHEQNKIISFLASIDEEIKVLEGEIKGNREFKKGLLQQMFV